MKKSNRFRNITIVLVLVGLLCASDLGAGLTAISFFTVIGIPIAIAITLLPTIALVTVLAYLIWRFTPMSGRIGILGGYAVAIFLMLAVPPLHNFEIMTKVQQLTANDIEPAGGPVLQVGRDTVIGLPNTDRKASHCDLTCMHMLVSNQAQAVIKTRFDKQAMTPDFSAKGYKYWLERSSKCDLSFVVAYGPDFKEQRNDTIAGAYGKMVDRDICIIRSEARLSDADFVVSARWRQNFPQPSTFSPISSEIRASRSGIYKPDDKGVWQSVWQKTSVEYSTLKPILAHAWRQSGYTLDAEWWREHFRADPFRNLRKTLGFLNYNMPERLR